MQDGFLCQVQAGLGEMCLKGWPAVTFEHVRVPFFPIETRAPEGVTPEAEIFQIILIAAADASQRAAVGRQNGRGEQTQTSYAARGAKVRLIGEFLDDLRLGLGELAPAAAAREERENPEGPLQLRQKSRGGADNPPVVLEGLVRHQAMQPFLSTSPAFDYRPKSRSSPSNRSRPADRPTSRRFPRFPRHWPISNGKISPVRWTCCGRQRRSTRACLRSG